MKNECWNLDEWKWGYEYRKAEMLWELRMWKFQFILNSFIYFMSMKRFEKVWKDLSAKTTAGARKFWFFCYFNELGVGEVIVKWVVIVKFGVNHGTEYDSQLCTRCYRAGPELKQYRAGWPCTHCVHAGPVRSHILRETMDAGQSLYVHIM